MTNRVFLGSLICIALLLSCAKKEVTPGVKTTDSTSSTEPVLTPQNAKTYLVDKNATEKTVALFYNLKISSKTKVLVGQQDAFNGFYKNTGGDSDIKKTTGSDPAVLGSDFIFITDINNDGQSNNWFHQQEVNTVNHVKEAYAKGMVNIFCWHIREPYAEKSFYVTEMPADVAAKAFKSILPGGENHEWYKTKLDKVASVFSNLKAENGDLIPVVFRPFHEYDGNWFWWGANFCTAAEFKKAFQFTVTYLKDTKGVHNVLYSLGPDNNYDTEQKYLSRYPGDEYVDIVGMDNYWDLRDGTGQAGADLANKKLKVVSNLAKARVKIAALTETGFQVTPANSSVAGWFSNYVHSTVTKNDVEIAFVMFWGNSGDSYFVPAPVCANAADFIDFTNKPGVLLQNELPDLYVLPK